MSDDKATVYLEGDTLMVRVSIADELVGLGFTPRPGMIARVAMSAKMWHALLIARRDGRDLGEVLNDLPVVIEFAR